LRDRWIRFRQAADVLSNLAVAGNDQDRRQRSGGKETAADFRDLLVDVLLAKRELKEENEIIRQIAAGHEEEGTGQPAQ
jgi:hypothetical protein